MPVVNQFTVEQVSTPEAREEALQIRFDVFIKEQRVGPDVESDEYDLIDPHWLVRNEAGAAIATARVTDKGNGLGKLERVAVCEDYRKQGVGRILIQAIERDALKMGFSQFIVHAQTHCIQFYEKLGYHVVDETVFLEDNIPHVLMGHALA